jgi:hypothetical protein
MNPQLIAQSPDGEMKMYATAKIQVGEFPVYWGYIESGGEKTKKFNLSTVLSTNSEWKIVNGIEI